ncbi:MAG TPA: serine--tRNA ligase, partial [Bacteroidetes bacterium]|nr:serine--tRNA ligase [Bacteroidota bacterium]
MLDLQFIRDHTDAVKAAITNKSAGDPASVDALLELDADWRRITTDLQETQT